MMNPAIIREFHSKYYTTDNMTIILSGKIHPKTSELLNKYFGEINSVKKQEKDFWDSHKQ